MTEIKKKNKPYAEMARLCGKNESSIREVMKNKEIISLLYRLLRIRLIRKNTLLSYVREGGRERERETDREKWERERESTLKMCNIVYSTLYYYFI